MVPSWQTIFQAARETAKLHLKDFAAPYWVDRRNERVKMVVEMEEEAKVKMLGRLFEKIKGKGTVAVRLGKSERTKVWASVENNSPESDQVEREEHEALTSIVSMFKMNE